MTFVENGRPNPQSTEEILDEMMLNAEEAFGKEFSAEEALALRSFYRPAAEYFAGQQDDLAEVLDSAQIDYAEGQALDLLAQLIGVRRKEARGASTRLQFQHDTPVSRDYSIPQGTGAQTDSAATVVFETDSATSLELFDDFEDNSLSNYTGDTGIASVQSSTVYEGSYALELSASTGTVIDTGPTAAYGSRLHCRVNLPAGTEAGFLFGASDTDNYYSAVLDEAGGNIRLDVREGGSTSTIGSVSQGLPAGEFLHLRVDWKPDGEFTITVFDAAGSELASADFSETEPTFESGGFGFQSYDANASKYFDNATTSRVAVDATATTTGSETNVSTGYVDIMSSSVSGVDEVTNIIPGTGGRDREEDDDYRERAKSELAEGLRATLPALINRIWGLPGTRTVSVIDNDTNSTDGDGRPGHSFEVVVDADSDTYDEVAETIVDTKAVGDTSVGGYAGTAVTRTVELSNEQTKDITFSTATEVTIYVDVTLDKTAEYGGDDQVKDNIVQYVGGVLLSGDAVSGELGVGDDVIYNKILGAVMDVAGVYDVTTLEVGTSSDPTGTSSLSISNTEMASIGSPDTEIGVTSNDA